jgi:hypothetical protein
MQRRSLGLGLLVACASGEPAPVIETEVILDLGARGLSPDADAKPIVDAALEEALAILAEDGSLPVVLRFPPGDFGFAHPSEPALAIANTAGPLVLRGAGLRTTSLRFEQFDQYGILLGNADRVTIEGLHLTRPGLYTTQGEVTAVQPGRIRFAIHAGFPDPIPLVDAPGALDNDRTLIRFTGPPADPALAPNSVSYKLCPAGRADCASPLTLVADREYEAILDDVAEVADLEVGDRVALKAKAGEQTVRAEDCDDLVVRDVLFTRNAAVTLAVKGDSNRTVIERVRVERGPLIEGRAPFFAGPGGGPQVTAGTEGPVIRDCVIEGTTDDAIAVFSDRAATPMRGARIEHNTIRDGQGRGINITQSTDGVVANNTIVRCQNPSIQIKSNQASEGTGAVVRWTISGNRLVQPWTDPAIFLTRENGEAAGRHDEITIVDNIIEEASRANPVLHVRNTLGLEVRDNTIASFSDELDVPGRGLPSGLVPIVFVEDAQLVTGTGNTCTTPTPRPAVVIDAGNPGTVDLAWAGAAP